MSAFRGLEPGTRPAIPPHPKHGPEEAVYPYVAADGAPIFFVCRYRVGDSKTFLQGRPTSSGSGWAWNLRGVEPVLYHLDELAEHLASGARGPVYIVEGEKDADRLTSHLREHELEGVVTSSPMGAGKWRESYTETLTGARHVIVIVDNDEPGFRHGRAIVDELGPVVDRVQLFRPAIDVEHADVSDHLDAELELDELIPLEDAIEATPAELAEGPVFTDVEDFIRIEEVPPEPLWGTDEHNLLVQGGLAIFAGPPGVGKTTFIIDLGMHLACGLPYPPVDSANERAPSPWPVARPLNVAFIENEGPLSLFRDKVRRYLESFPHRPTERGGKLIVQTWRWGTFSFADPEAFVRVSAELDEHEVDLVIGDPLSLLGPEGVGAPDQTAQFVSRLRALGLGTSRSFLFLHHFTKRREKEDDELSALSGAWGAHLDSLVTLAATGAENEARLNFAKLRWARAELPKPALLGRVYARAGFELLGLEDDVTMLEPKIAAALEELRREGAGVKGWSTSTALALKIGKSKRDVPKALEGAPHLFVMKTGDAAKTLGARTKNTKLWGLKSWTDDEADDVMLGRTEQPELELEGGELEWR